MSGVWYNVYKRGRILRDRVLRLNQKGDSMVDKIIEQARSHASVKKVCIFFAAFAVTVTLMGGPLGDKLGGGTLTAGVVYASEQSSGTEEATADQVSSKPEKAKKTKKEGSAETKSSKEAKPAEKKEWKAAPKDAEAAEGGFVYYESIPMSYELQEYTYQKCVERNIEYELVLAVIWRESRFEADAVNVNANGTLDSGIMQINDVNKKWLYEDYGVEDLMDPYQNIDAGTAMLGVLTEKHGAHKAMLAYQYGESGMIRKLNQGQTTSIDIERAYRQRDYYKQLRLSA